MRRMLDLECRKCGGVVRDKFFRSVPRVIVHARVADSKCKGVMDQVFLPIARNAGWGDRDAVVVFKKADGSISYPGRNDAPTPKGCERVVMRSLREVEKFEKANNVLCEAAHYNRGNGPEPQDFIDRRPPESERFAAFMRGWNG
jgi:hypothetical protein